MATRNMTETIQKFDVSSIPDAYQMRASEMEELQTQIMRNPLKSFSVINKAFLYGFVLGRRAEQARRRKAAHA